MDKIKSLSKRIVAVLLVAFAFSLLFGILVKVTNDNRKTKIGVNAVQLLYQFKNLEELGRHQNSLKNITTEDVFDIITVDNEERTLNTYLKFRGNSCDVQILKARPNYVLYRIDCESIDSDRTFIFLFDVDNSGKINYVREEECIDFIENNK